ncbi:MAG: hypothetical protein ACTSU2_11195 [Promethearchaeota archaeon]
MIDVVYSPIEYWLYIPKIIEMSINLFLGIKICRSKKYIVNKIFGSALLVWIIYTASDMIIWTRAADSIVMNNISNVVRDVQIFAATIFAYLIYFGSRVIKTGLKALKIWKMVMIFVVYMVVAGLMAISERIVVKGESGQELEPSEWLPNAHVIITGDINVLFMVLMVLPLVLYIMAVVTLWGVRKRSSSEEARRKMLYLTLGIILIAVGIIYFAVIFALNVNSYLIFWYTMGRVFWVSASILIWLSQGGKDEE